MAYLNTLRRNDQHWHANAARAYRNYYLAFRSARPTEALSYLAQARKHIAVSRMDREFALAAGFKLP